MLNTDKNLVTAQKLYKDGDYHSSLPLLEYIYYESKDAAPILFVGSMLLGCYQKLSLWDKALMLGESLSKLDDCWDSIKNSYAWVLYFAFFKNAPETNTEDAVIKIDQMEKLLSKQANKLPLALAVFSLISKAELIAPTLVLQLLEKLDFCSLQATSNAAANGKNYPSHREQYISHYSKALFMAEDYRRCSEYCNSILGSNEQLSHDNRIWIMRRLALSLHRLQESAAAYSILKQVATQKQDWYILFELAQIASALHEHEDALRYAAQAAIARGELEMKIHLWDFLFSALKSQKAFSEAVKCLSLAAALRFQHGWKIDAALFKELSALNLDPPSLPPAQHLYMELLPWLQDQAIDKNSLKEGTIQNILPHGKAGFIRSGSSSYYFKTSACRFPQSELNPGLRVRFCLQKSFDPKKQMDSEIAMAIQRCG